MSSTPPTPAPSRPGPPLPAARGPLSEALLARFGHGTGPLPPPHVADALADDDLQLALYCCYELHYRSFDGVDEALEWEPELLGWRATLEAGLERAVRAAVGERVRPVAPQAVPDELRRLARTPGPSLSGHLEREGTIEQLRELAVHRSAYQLKEADPHSWALPRLDGAPKAALVEVQMEEYGEGVERDMHSSLWEDTLRELGLDPTYGAYLDLVPGTTLAVTNLISWFGLHRRWRGALVGQLAMFEMTSVTPNRRYGRALDRLGLGPGARRFFDVHVEADESHQDVAADELAGRLVADEPGLAADVLFGAAAGIVVEQRFAAALLDAWSAGRTSLRRPLGA